MTRRPVDAGAEKQRRQKLLLAGLAVVLVAVLAIQLPSLLGSSDAASAPEAPIVAPTPAAAPAAAAVVDRGAVAHPAEGQLASVARFAVARDPFAAPQEGVSEEPPAAPAPPVADAPPAPAPTTADPAPATPKPEPAPEPKPGPEPKPAPEPKPEPAPEPKPAPEPTPEPSTAPEPAPAPAAEPAPAKPQQDAPALPVVTPLSRIADAPGPPPPVPAAKVPGGALAHSGGATIVVNGAAEDVRVGTAFPKASPFFRLVELEGGRAVIAPAGGSFAGGAEQTTLVAGTTLTLTNTADGTQFELRLGAVR